MGRSRDRADAEFDVIIVGGGSAGCVLANRLTADGRHTVLLIEAGEDDGPLRNPRQFLLNSLIHIPVGFAVTMNHPRTTWGLKSEPVPGTGGRRFDMIRGRVLGGSSAINAMLYVRGESQDYERWRQAGCIGWGWDDVLPYFRKAEHFEGGGDDWQGSCGPLNVRNATLYPIMESMIDAAAAMGIPRSASFNRGVQYGGGAAQHSIRRGRRHSTATAYLDPARRRHNLSIATGTLATSVLLSGRRATGVAWRRGDTTGTYRARREVILAGGAFNSPQLLELSGIGQAERLRGLGIAVALDAPRVGENLQDHYYAPVTWRLRAGVDSINRKTQFPAIAMEALRYGLTRRGLLSESAVQMFIYAKSRPEVETADIQYSLVPASMSHGKERGERIEGETAPGMTLASCQLRPSSIGSSHIVSSDAAAKPAIQPNYLADRGDQLTQIAGLKLARELGGHLSLEPYVEAETTPGASIYGDDQLLDYIRTTGGTVHHPVGTVAMGGEGAPLDPRLRVRGITSLRVVDASIMPFLISGNTNSPTIMVAERASELILEDLRQPRRPRGR